jgi:hypothetical protein
MPVYSQLSGVRGWLAFLVISLTILGPIQGLARMNREFETAEEKFPNLHSDVSWILYKRLSWYLFAAMAAVGIAAGYRLWKAHVKESVRFAIVALWLVGPGAWVGGIAAMLVAFGINAGREALRGSAWAETAVAGFASVIVAGAWTAYLARSVRVRNTYAGLSRTAQGPS